MALKNQTTSFTVKLLGWKQLAEGADKGGASLRRLGTEAAEGERKAGAGRGWGIFERKVHKAEERSKKARVSIGGLAKTAIGFGAGFEAIEGIGESIDQVTELGHAAISLHNIQGLGIRQGADLAAVAQTQNLSNAALSTSFKKLAKTVGDAQKQRAAYTTAGAKASDTEAKQIALRQSTQRRLATLGASASDQVKRQLVLQEYQQKRAAIQAAAEGKVNANRAKGVGNAAMAFKTLGITQDELRKSGTNLLPLTEKIADKLAEMKGGAQKTALIQQLFGGRGAQGIGKLFREGDIGLRGLIETNDKYVGSQFNSAKEIEKRVELEAKSKAATLGLQVAIGGALLPAVLKLEAAWPRLVDNVREGNGAWGTVRTILGGVVAGTKAVVGVFQGSEKATKALVWSLGALGAALAIEKIIEFARWTKELVVVEKAWAAATWLVNAAMGASTVLTLAKDVRSLKDAWVLLNLVVADNPLVAAGIALVAVGAGLYVAYKKVKWFHDAVDSTWRFIKNNWPQLLAVLTGPIGLATLYIVRHWNGMVRTVKGLPKRLARAGAGMWDWMAGEFKRPLNWIIGKWNGLHFGFDGIKVAGRTVVPGVHVGTPDIPKLARGGVAREPGSIIVGDGGRPELLTVPKGARVDPLPAGGGAGGMREELQAIRRLLEKDLILNLDGKVLARANRNQVSLGRAAH